MSFADFDKCLEDLARQAITIMDKADVIHSDFSGLANDNATNDSRDTQDCDNDNSGNNNNYIASGITSIADSEKRKIINNALLEYFSIFGKLIAPKKRNVFYSKELQDKINNASFTGKDGSIVSSEEAEEIKNLISHFDKLFKDGNDINNHLSTGIFVANRPDTLLYTWNVKHIHLNTKEAVSKGDMHDNRSGWLLFVIVGDDVNGENNKENRENKGECAVYFLDVQYHPKGSGFSSYHFLEIIHNNGWMEKAGFVPIPQGEPQSVEFTVSDTETLYKLYKAHINIPFKFQGTVYFPKAGMTTAGTNVQDTLNFNHWKRRLQQGFKNREYVSYSISSSSPTITPSSLTSPAPSSSSSASPVVTAVAAGSSTGNILFDGIITFKEGTQHRQLSLNDFLKLSAGNVQNMQNAQTSQEAVQQTDNVHNGQTQTKKIGRNEPCPCGSGKKYKFCHGKS